MPGSEGGATPAIAAVTSCPSHHATAARVCRGARHGGGRLGGGRAPRQPRRACQEGLRPWPSPKSSPVAPTLCTTDFRGRYNLELDSSPGTGDRWRAAWPAWRGSHLAHLEPCTPAVRSPPPRRLPFGQHHAHNRHAMPTARPPPPKKIHIHTHTDTNPCTHTHTCRTCAAQHPPLDRPPAAPAARRRRRAAAPACPAAPASPASGRATGSAGRRRRRRRGGARGPPRASEPGAGATWETAQQGAAGREAGKSERRSRLACVGGGARAGRSGAQQVGWVRQTRRRRFGGPRCRGERWPGNTPGAAGWLAPPTIWKCGCRVLAGPPVQRHVEQRGQQAGAARGGAARRRPRRPLGRQQPPEEVQQGRQVAQLAQHAQHVQRAQLRRRGVLDFAVGWGGGAAAAAHHAPQPPRLRQQLPVAGQQAAPAGRFLIQSPRRVLPGGAQERAPKRRSAVRGVGVQHGRLCSR
jgi:hypothetical protein